VLAEREVGYSMCRSKLAEILEKVLKAELIRIGWFLEKTHDLEKLSGELRSRRSDLLPQVDPLCEDLTEAYFTDRYPGFDLEDPNWPDFRTKLEEVAGLLITVKARVAGQFGQT
jgi:HEPN domain-containing protein